MIYTIHIQPGGYTFTANPGETVLEAALRHGYDFPNCCQNAICGSCKGQLIEGKVNYDIPVYALTDEEREMGYALFCAAKPLTDLLIHVENVVAPRSFPLRRLSCSVINLEQLSGHVIRVLLTQDDEPLSYLAGQYLEILHLDTSPKPFSIANAPSNSHQLELHIRNLPDNLYTVQLMQDITQTKKLRIAGPFGSMIYRRDPALPLLLVAGGTGFAPYKAILEQAFSDKNRKPIYLYWGARTRADLYWHKEILEWAKQYSDFHYIPVLSKPKAGDKWQGETGLVHEIVMAHHHQLSKYHIYLSGPPEMVYAAQRAFLIRGASKAYLYSDLFDYQPT